MDRTAFVACALMLAPAALSVGCGTRSAPATTDQAPHVLAELQQSSPGPWRNGTGRVAPTSLQRPVENLGLTQPLDAAELNELDARIHHAPPRFSPAEVAAPAVSSPAGESRPTGSRDESPEVSGGEAWPRQGEKEAASAVSDAGPFPVLIDPMAEMRSQLAHASDTSVDQGRVDEGRGRPRTLEVIASPSKSVSQHLPSTVAPLPEQRGALPWSGQPAPSGEMKAVLEQSEERLRKAFQLADRQALYLAREEFVAVLVLIAQANDAQRGTQFHSESLTSGLTALNESRDFTKRRPLGKDLDFERIVSGHKTRLLKDANFDSMTSNAAARVYYNFAQEQLSGAAGGEAHSSIALYGLGRLATTNSNASPDEQMAWTAQAMVLYQASLMADHANFRAANELGVILAENGHLPQARNLFVHSVRLSPHPSIYRNLVIVHSRLGETQLASAAGQQAIALEKSGKFGRGPSVQWVDPSTFAGTAPPSDTVMPPVTTPNQPESAPTVENKQPPVSTARKSSGDWLPWKR